MKDSNSGLVIKCTPGKPNACPESGICYYDSVDNINKCCAKDPGIFQSKLDSESIENSNLILLGDGCPSGTKPQKNSANQSIQCRPGVASQSCPGSGVCQWNYLVDRYQCCEADNGTVPKSIDFDPKLFLKALMSSGCPVGTSPLIEATVVRTCKKELSGQCPTNFNCEYNFWSNNYQCCGKDVGRTNNKSFS